MSKTCLYINSSICTIYVTTKLIHNIVHSQHAPAWIQHAVVHKTIEYMVKYQRLHTVAHQTMLCINYDIASICVN